MEQRISIITLAVSDLAKSKAFYDSLGWKAINEDEAEGIVAYNINGMAFALYPYAKLGEEFDVPSEMPTHAAFTMAYNTRSENEVDDVLKHVQSVGGNVVKMAEKVFWGGYSGYFADPDGNMWEVAYNPFSPLGPNGEFQWGGVE